MTKHVEVTTTELSLLVRAGGAVVFTAPLTALADVALIESMLHVVADVVADVVARDAHTLAELHKQGAHEANGRAEGYRIERDRAVEALRQRVKREVFGTLVGDRIDALEEKVEALGRRVLDRDGAEEGEDSAAARAFREARRNREARLKQYEAIIKQVGAPEGTVWCLDPAPSGARVRLLFDKGSKLTERVGVAYAEEAREHGWAVNVVWRRPSAEPPNEREACEAECWGELQVAFEDRYPQRAGLARKLIRSADDTKGGLGARLTALVKGWVVENSGPNLDELYEWLEFRSAAPLLAIFVEDTFAGAALDIHERVRLEHLETVIRRARTRHLRLPEER